MTAELSAIEPLAALAFPDIDPFVFRLADLPVIGTFGLRWYSLAYIAGIVFVWKWFQWLLRQPHLWDTKPPLESQDVDDMIFTVFMGVLLGGRLGYVIFYNPSHFLANPIEIPQVWKGGMSFHGGLTGVIVAAWYEARKRGVAMLTVFDLLAAGAPIGVLFGRIANFINGELFGRPSDVPWAMVFPHGGPEARHPSQLYEAALEGAVLMVVVSIAVLRFGALKRPGMVAGLFCAGYGVARFIVEFFRMPDPQLGFLFGGATMGMMLSTPMILAGAALVWYTTRARAQA